MSSSSKLTPKRRHFARLVASGKSQADAYRTAFDCQPGSLSKTQVEEASKLCADPNVATTIRQLIDARDRAQRDKALSHRQIVLDRLLLAVDDDSFGLGRLKALDLLATVSGMKKQSLDITQDNRSSDTILADLKTKLAALGLDDTETTIDHGSTMNDGSAINDDQPIDPAPTIDDPVRH
jgi:nucleotide-binding universal stress UspA family protein|tara:strand:+ start:1073 stop:1612 length:540 start_codon:yes stop_codon:yes gene_type:complete